MHIIDNHSKHICPDLARYMELHHTLSGNYRRKWAEETSSRRAVRSKMKIFTTCALVVLLCCLKVVLCYTWQVARPQGMPGVRPQTRLSCIEDIATKQVRWSWVQAPFAATNAQYNACTRRKPKTLPKHQQWALVLLQLYIIMYNCSVNFHVRVVVFSKKKRNFTSADMNGKIISLYVHVHMGGMWSALRGVAFMCEGHYTSTTVLWNVWAIQLFHVSWEGRWVEVQVSSHSLQTSGDDSHQLREMWSLPWLHLPTLTHHTISDSIERRQ